MKYLVGVVVASAVVLAGAAGASARCTDDAAVAAARAAVAAQCPCDGFPNHGQYVRCARGVANDLADAGLLPRNCKGAVVSCAARSTCGKPGFVTCCTIDKRGKTRCSIKKDASKCKAPKGGTSCVGQTTSCCDACANGCPGVTPTPPPTPTPTPEPTPTPTAPPPTPTPPYGSASQAFVVDVPSLLE
jgi:hypothetical protein